MTKDPFKKAPDADVPVPRAGPPRSKAWAVRHLSKFFVKPAIQSITTPADSAGGLARWRVLCHHRDTGKAIGLVEVAGPAEALAKAALVAACRRISIAVMFDALGGVSFEPAPAVPVPPP